MDKTTPQGKGQELNSTSSEEAMCDKAADSSQEGMVDSSAASFNAKSVRGARAKEEKKNKKNKKQQTVGSGSIKTLDDLDHCIEMYHHMRLGTRPSSSTPKYLVIDPAKSDSDEAWTERIRLLSLDYQTDTVGTPSISTKNGKSTLNFNGCVAWEVTGMDYGDAL